MATSFTNAELVVRDQFLLGMKNQPLPRTLREKLKLEPGLMMHQVLKEAIALEKKEQVKTPLVTTPASVREDGMERHMSLLEEVVGDLCETLTMRTMSMPKTASDIHPRGDRLQG